MCHSQEWKVSSVLGIPSSVSLIVLIFSSVAWLQGKSAVRLVFIWLLHISKLVLMDVSKSWWGFKSKLTSFLGETTCVLLSAWGEGIILSFFLSFLLKLQKLNPRWFERTSISLDLDLSSLLLWMPLHSTF